MKIFEYYTIIGGIALILAILYKYMPTKLTGEKNDNVSFVLFDLAILWLINIAINISGFEREHLSGLIALLFLPVSAIFYWLFPFKQKRNQAFSFIITCAAIIEALSAIIITLLVSISNM